VQKLTIVNSDLSMSLKAPQKPPDTIIKEIRVTDETEVKRLQEVIAQLKAKEAKFETDIQ
jgi:hypothetical protein